METLPIPLQDEHDPRSRVWLRGWEDATQGMTPNEKERFGVKMRTLYLIHRFGEFERKREEEEKEFMRQLSKDTQLRACILRIATLVRESSENETLCQTVDCILKDQAASIASPDPSRLFEILQAQMQFGPEYYEAAIAQACEGVSLKEKLEVSHHLQRQQTIDEAESLERQLTNLAAARRRLIEVDQDLQTYLQTLRNILVAAGQADIWQTAYSEMVCMAAGSSGAGEGKVGSSTSLTNLLATPRNATLTRANTL
eukprot:comp43169_c0_seq1/m.47469 comp43169_c0_seq1/g.47469  ORF comp43169_c0_seq1/g.47469 comp43169_c0_seq1/m.47469 type:complete len:256 (-) comp43169_c0_seq1:90-857(-)